VTAPVIGPSVSSELSSAVDALDLCLDDVTLEQLDQIFPGYKTAPEDYAW
jgi:aryl-alcohol dehydrogenase-like predicted oxidoreductase